MFYRYLLLVYDTHPMHDSDMIFQSYKPFNNDKQVWLELVLFINF